jgi:hypothetical protein
MKTENEISINLNENQLLAVQMLAAGQSGRTVAKQLGVTPETVSRWRQNPLFNEQLNIALWEMYDITKQRLSGMATKALDAIEEAFDAETIQPKDRFTMGLKMLELCGIAENTAKKIYSEIDLKQLTYEELGQLREGKYVDLSRFFKV